MTQQSSDKLVISSSVIKTGLRLALFALFGIGLVILTYHVTKDRIDIQQQQLLEETIGQLIPSTYYDEPLVKNCVLLTDNSYGHQVYKAYLAIDKNKKLRAIALNVIATTGYNGDMTLLLAFDVSTHNLLGVRVLTQQETPGLGDKIELKRSSWVLGFNGLHFDPTDLKFWGVKKDGGHFDQFTGATITPRAVVLGVKEALQFLQQQLLQQSPIQIQQMPSCGTDKNGKE